MSFFSVTLSGSDLKRSPTFKSSKYRALMLRMAEAHSCAIAHSEQHLTRIDQSFVDVDTLPEGRYVQCNSLAHLNAAKEGSNFIACLRFLCAVHQRKSAAFFI